jgi:hypothetical protein
MRPALALALAVCLLAAGSALYAAPSVPPQRSMSNPAPVWTAFSDPSGSCTTQCSKAGTRGTLVSWGATESQCCSSNPNPCPTGYTPTALSFQPLGGTPVLCLGGV